MEGPIRIASMLVLLAASSNSLAWWGGNGWDWNPWPVWTPMYWMEEVIGDDDRYGPYGYGGYGPYGYNGYYPYGYAPYGYQGYTPGYPGPGYGYGPYRRRGY